MYINYGTKKIFFLSDQTVILTNYALWKPQKET